MYMDRNITPYEQLEAINNLQIGKSPGNDEFPVECYRHSCPKWLKPMLLTLTVALEKKYTSQVTMFGYNPAT